MAAMKLLHCTHISKECRAQMHYFTSKRLNTTRYGFIGFDEMASMMRKNLIHKTKKSGSLVYVYDIHPLSLKDAANNGAIAVSSPSELRPCL